MVLLVRLSVSVFAVWFVSPAAQLPVTPAGYETTTSYNPKNNIWDIAMFVLAGILIIVLLEQLFQIASAIGMRNTIAYLKSLDNI